MSGNYILAEDGKTPFETDLATWCKWFEKADRKVANTVNDNVRVSTVFLGINHNFGEGPPLLFETMIFGGEYDDEQWRYATWNEALAGHKKACDLITQETSR